MIIEEQPKYCLQDLSVVPAVISKIDSRSECNPFTHDKKYPIFCAPMNCVTNENNYDIWESERVQPILPRTVNYDTRIAFLKSGSWVALSQKEFEKLFADKTKPFYTNMTYKVCIDTANAHRKSIYDSVNKAKKIASDNGYELIVMVGNIARPDTYRWICENAKVDYVRLNIGSGKGCFVEGTKITTKTGYKNIEDVLVDDEVLTIDGTYQPVENIISFNKKKSLIKINNDITCTDNHKFLVINKEDKNVCNEDNLEKFGYWVEAKQLNPEKHLLIKRY